MPRHFKKLKPGQPISAKAVNELQRSVEALQRVGGHTGLGTGATPRQGHAGVAASDSHFRPFYARIIDRDRGIRTKLLNEVLVSDEEITVLWHHLLPEPPFRIVVGCEIMQVKIGVVSDTLHTPGGGGFRTATYSVERAKGGTTPRGYAAGTIVETVNRPYAFQEVFQDPPGYWNDHANGRATEITVISETKRVFSPAALDVRAEQMVPIDGSAIVQMWLGYDSQTYYLFEYPDSGGSTASLNVANDQTWKIETTLGSNLAAGGTTMNVASLGNFPSRGRFFIVVNSLEIMLVKEGAGSKTWTVERAMLGTTAIDHGSGATVRWILPEEIDRAEWITFEGDSFVQPGNRKPNEAIHHEVCQPIKLSSSEKDADGFYPGTRRRYDPVKRSVVDGETIKIIDLDDPPDAISGDSDGSGLQLPGGGGDCFA